MSTDNMTSFIKKHIHPTFLSWEVKEEGQDEKSFNRWANTDVIPTPAHERNYTGRGYFGFWCVFVPSFTSACLLCSRLIWPTLTLDLIKQGRRSGQYLSMDTRVQ